MHSVKAAEQAQIGRSRSRLREIVRCGLRAVRLPESRSECRDSGELVFDLTLHGPGD
jgi:hypothetical protein